MGKGSAISWTDHTFNPWIGCEKVSAGCTNCYAERDMDKRFGRAKWGKHGTRDRTSPKNWSKVRKWNRDVWGECPECSWRGSILTSDKAFNYECPTCGSGCTVVVQRVFCASLSDVFEDRDGLVEYRRELFDLISETKALNWMLLTKRPENINKMIEESTGLRASLWLGANDNVWIGTSVENQEQADKRIPELLKVRASVLFLSMEPLLGPVDFEVESGVCHCGTEEKDHNPYSENHSYVDMPWNILLDGIGWVIVGGESGPNARPMSPEWVRVIRDQCKQTDTAFHFKQGSSSNWSNYRAFDSFPTDLQVREFPNLNTRR